MKVLLNDEILERNEAKVDIEDRGYQFGDGVYEVVNIYDGVPFTLKEHIARLYRSAKEIGILLNEQPEQLCNRLLELIKANNMTNGGLYLQISRGVFNRTHHYDQTLTPQLVAYPLPYKSVQDAQTNGVEAITAEDLRWLRCDIKSLNLLYNIMVKQKASEAGAFESILIRDGIVTEGSSSNIFIVKDGILRTHPANNLILNGITRRKLLEIMDANGWDYKIQPFHKEELMEADEVFLTSTTSEVMPIIKIDGVTFSQAKPGPYTSKFQAAFREAVKSETKTTTEKA
ncbi:D-amino-acid transaminase [Sutcliffiella horikoshii]|uniref:D-alanine aminotransferase n=1 Tax=Sutcliffiella horikoshii TaxID=79883 RepID=A0ABN4ZE08_9BACI|nr:D-amino-acid transaminase [Sutcliffiella horikoshii]ART76572.1 D-amino-acid transaminase [Sutcliffiella horikoshii]